MTDKLSDLMAATVAKITEAIESGRATGEWVPPWSITAGGLHHQAVSTKPYRGANQLVLMMSAFLDGRDDPRWATYKTWASVDAQVRKGEHGTRLVKWGQFHVCDVHGKGRQGCGCPMGRSHLYANAFTVFNGGQVDGAEPYEAADPTWDTVEAAEKIVANSGAHVLHADPSRAFFAPRYPERVNTPPREAFDTAEKFYGTLFHELVHWSGHESRLDRTKGKSFGDDQYAAEELVAEIGSAFLGAHCRMQVGAHMDAAQYLASWLKVLKADPKRLYTAAKLAQEAADFLV